MVDSDGAKTVRRIPVLLSRGQRAASGAIGIVLCAVGSAATFVTENQAGSTTLILLGGLGGLLSVTGRVPDRIGREGVVHERDDAPATDLLAELLDDDDLPRALKEHIAQAVSDRLNVAPNTGAPSHLDNDLLERHSDGPIERLNSHAAYVLFEKQALDILAASLPPDLRLRDAKTVARSSGGKPFDAYLEPADALDERWTVAPGTIGVEVKRYRRLGGFYDAMRQIEQGVTAQSVAGAVLIAEHDSPVPEGFEVRYATVRVLHMPPANASADAHSAVLREWRSRLAALSSSLRERTDPSDDRDADIR